MVSSRRPWAARFRERLRRSSAEPAQANPRGAGDIWLKRISYVSQFGLFVLTLAALYYTVLPLYQKALLEESIARKELELKQISTDLEKVYGRLRMLAVKEFIFHAGASCSGLFEPAATPIALADKVPTTPRSDERIFAIDVGKCLSEEIKQTPSLRDLRKQDYEILVGKVNEIVVRIAEKRKQAILDHDSLPERARSNPSLLPTPTGFRANAIDLLEKLTNDLNRAMVSGRKLESKERFDKERQQLALRIAQEKVTYAYTDEIRREISTLRNVKWSTEH